MKLSYEVPIKYLDHFNKYNDYDFLLCSLCDNVEYVEFFKNRNSYKILDNGAFECPKPYTFEELLKLNEQVNANCIVLPDFIGEGYKTVRTVDKICANLNYKRVTNKSNEIVELMGVVQGKDLLECFYSYEYFVNNPYINIIGISYVGQPVPRIDLLRLISIKYFSGNRDILVSTRIHLLGLSTPDELKEVVDLRLPVESCDTTLPITYGLAEWDFNKQHFNKGRTKLNFDISELTNNQLKCIEGNIEYLRKSIE